MYILHLALKMKISFIQFTRNFANSSILYRKVYTLHPDNIYHIWNLETSYFRDDQLGRVPAAIVLFMFLFTLTPPSLWVWNGLVEHWALHWHWYWQSGSRYWVSVFIGFKTNHRITIWLRQVQGCLCYKKLNSKSKIFLNWDVAWVINNVRRWPWWHMEES